MIGQVREEKSKVFERIFKEIFELRQNPVFESEVWAIPADWVRNEDFSNIERIVKEKPKKMIIIRDKKLVEIDLFTEKKIEVVSKVEEVVEVVSTDWKSSDFKPSEETPF